MNKKIAVAVLTLALLMTSTLVAPALALVFSPPTYTQKAGKLGGADFLLRFPNPITKWKGGLVIYLRGYSPTLPNITTVLTPSNNISALPIQMGYAVAFSNFGEGGMCFQKAAIRTHQLTEWIIDNYEVTGKIYLIGVSMGGNVALQLGAKYPDLYDGVLDLCSPKDMAFEYNDKMFLASLSDSALLNELASRGVTTAPLPNAPLFKAICSIMAADIAIECGGLPSTKPKAYERISPTYSAVDLAVPTITLHGTKDSLVPLGESLSYKDAVVAAGHSSLYRLYKVTNALHAGATLLAQLFQPPYSAFAQLVDWVEKGNPADPSSP